MKVDRILSLFLILLCVLFAGSALAEAQLEHASGALYADGALPAELSAPDLCADGEVSFDSYLTAALKALETEVDISQFGLSREAFNAAYPAVLNRHAELFYVNSSWSYRTVNGVVIAVLPEYRYSAASLPGRIADFNAAVRKVARYAQSAATDVGKLLLVHDYFCVNFKYDTTYSIYAADQLFEQGTGVCQAYAMAFRAVLDELGIRSTVAVSDEMGHMWNMVKLGSSWYHIDVTWGDPIPDMHLRATHGNFLRSDKGIRATGHYGWEASVSASSTKYDKYFWQNLLYPIPVSGSNAYYIPTDFKDTRRNIRAFNLSTEKSSSVYTYDYGNYGYYREFNPVWVYGPDLYYAVRDKLYFVPLAGGKAQQIFSTGDSSQWIWSIFRSGDSLKLRVNNTPNSNGRVSKTPLKGVYALTLNKTALTMTAGSSTQLKAALSPKPDYEVEIAMISEDPSVASVSRSGKITAVAPGITRVSAYLYPDSKVTCEVLVRDDAPLRIPAGMSVIPEEAFMGIAAQDIVIPEGVTAIEADAFAGCSDLVFLQLPASLAEIAEGALPVHDSLTLLCPAEDSCAAVYARAHGLAYRIME